MYIIGLLSGNLGTDNQIRGLIEKYNEIYHLKFSEEYILNGLNNIILHPKNFKYIIEFKKAVYDRIDEFVKNCKIVPICVILPLNHSLLQNGENSDIDFLSLTVKEAFLRHNIHIKTLVLASNLYDYENVDIIHVCDHLLTEEDEIKLSNDYFLKEKVVKTIGVPSNISCEKIKNLANNHRYENIFAKYKGKKTILFCLGGISDSKAISFSIQDAINLLKSAIDYRKYGYEVVFVNSPRTPSDVTDYLYEECLNENIDFFNAKKIAKNQHNKNNFRFYNGRFKKEFLDMEEKIGNIYPAILSVCTKVCYTWDTFSYTSDAAVLGIPTLVYTGNKISLLRSDCHKLYKTCRDKSFILNLEEDMCFIEKGFCIETLPMEDVCTQIVYEIYKKCK